MLVEKQQIGVEGFQGSQGLIPLFGALCQGQVETFDQLTSTCPAGSSKGLPPRVMRRHDFDTSACHTEQ